MESYRGKLLIAGTDMLDPNFAQTVTLMVEHGEEGALGLVLNRPTKTRVPEAWEQVSDVPCHQEGVLYQGGPCSGPLMLLHTLSFQSQLEVAPGLHFTADADEIAWLMEHGRDEMRCYVGYAGWGAGQLESEIDRESWIVTPAKPEHVFHGSPRMWFELLRRINPTQAAMLLRPNMMPDDPSVN